MNGSAPTQKQKSNVQNKLVSRFRRVNFIFIAVIIVTMMAVSVFISYTLTDGSSRDYVRFYAEESVYLFNSFLSKEIAFVQHAASSEEIVEWFADENSLEKRYQAYQKMMHYADILQINSAYFAIKYSGHEFSINSDEPFENFKPLPDGDSPERSYVMNPELPYDSWFFEALNSEFDYTLNLDVDKVSLTRRLWINYKVMKDGEAIGIFCSALQFDDVFEALFGEYDNERVVGYIVDRFGIIQMDSKIPEPDFYVTGLSQLESAKTRFIIEEYTDPAFVSSIGPYFSPQNGGDEKHTLSDNMRFTAGSFRYFAIAPIPGTN